MNNILSLTNDEAKEFFLQSHIYCNIDLPNYFDFEAMLKYFDKKGHNQNNTKINNKNYILLNNKGGIFDWRKLQLIHPISYTQLVSIITEKTNWQKIQDRLKIFQMNQRITCLSIPYISLKKDRLIYLMSTDASHEICTEVTELKAVVIQKVNSLYKIGYCITDLNSERKYTTTECQDDFNHIRTILDKINFHYSHTLYKGSNKNKLLHDLDQFIVSKNGMIPKKSKSHKAVQIKSWLRHVEKGAIKLAMNFKNVLHTDISGCYGSIYTHSIAWALHDKDHAKAHRSDKELLGNRIDKLIRDTNDGQTNGIPEGSVLMDFIAEIILGYIDSELGDLSYYRTKI